jgi:hypothetical protein
MNITKQLDSILYCSVLDFEGLPQSIINDIDKLLLEVSKEELVTALTQLKITYDEELKNIRASKPGSGMADQFLIAAEMKVIYRQRTIEYLQKT